MEFNHLFGAADIAVLGGKFNLLLPAGAPTRIDVRTSGEVFARSPPGVQVAWLTLDNISYCTES